MPHFLLTNHVPVWLLHLGDPGCGPVLEVVHLQTIHLAVLPARYIGIRIDGEKPASCHRWKPWNSQFANDAATDALRSVPLRAEHRACTESFMNSTDHTDPRQSMILLGHVEWSGSRSWVHFIMREQYNRHSNCMHELVVIIRKWSLWFPNPIIFTNPTTS